MGPSPTEENLRWELQQAKIRIEQLEAKLRLSEGAFKNTRIKDLEAEVANLENQLVEAYEAYDMLSSEQ
jgi:cupin superfamily acireductone dioxygenase involved in methionine salvage